MSVSRNKKSAVIGSPGVSAKAAYRSRQVKFAMMPLRARVLGFATFTAVGALLGFLSGTGVLVGGLTGSGIALLIAGFLSVSEASAMLAVLVAYILASSNIVDMYEALSQTSYSSEWKTDLSTLLAVAAVYAFWVSAKYSRGRNWLTLLLALASTVTLGFALTYLVPSLQIFSAFLFLVTVLVLRCGGWVTISSWVSLAATPKDRYEDDVQVEGSDNVSSQSRIERDAWLVRAEAEEKTAKVLNSLGVNHTIFHDFKVSKYPHSISHLVVGSEGIFLLASIASAFPISENSETGVTLPDVPLGVVAASLLDQRKAVSNALKVTEDKVTLIVVAHPLSDEGVPADYSKTVAVFLPSDGDTPSTRLYIAGEAKLGSLVKSGIALISTNEYKNLVNRAKLNFKPAGAPTPTRWEPSAPVQLALFDADGNTKRPEPEVEEEELEWIEPGVQVHVSTTSGPLYDLRVTGPVFRDEFGRLVAPICVEEEWQSSIRSGRVPEAYVFPVAAIFPA